MGPFVELVKLASSNYEPEQTGYVVEGVYVQINQLEELYKMNKNYSYRSDKDKAIDALKKVSTLAPRKKHSNILCWHELQVSHEMSILYLSFFLLLQPLSSFSLSKKFTSSL